MGNSGYRTWRGVAMAASLLLLAATPAWANDISGPARVVDGNTVEVRGTRLSLASMDAPATGQSCSRFDTRYDCGRQSTAELTRIISGRPLRCATSSKDRNQKPLYRCWAQDIDVGREMVRRGWAIAANGYAYTSDEQDARQSRRGLWAGDFQRPADWRREQRQVR